MSNESNGPRGNDGRPANDDLGGSYLGGSSAFDVLIAAQVNEIQETRALIAELECAAFSSSMWSVVDKEKAGQLIRRLYALVELMQERLLRSLAVVRDHPVTEVHGQVSTMTKMSQEQNQ